MNRTDRLLAIILELQAKKHQRAEDLAATFEVSKRTIYRDVLALMESGVPVISMPGSGYSLVEGYFLPPLTFSTDEAIMLLLGADFVAQNFDAQYRTAAHSAAHKIQVVLPPPLRDEVEYLQRSIRFLAASQVTSPEFLQGIRRAIIQHKTVRFGYQARFSEGDSPEEREADPYALVHVSGVWHLVGYCHHRKAIRNFRLDRMDNLVVLEKTFVRPADFRIQRSGDESRKLIVRILFDAETTQWAKENRSFFQISEECCDDGLLVTLKARHEAEIMNWLLSWGSHIRILEPESLRERLLQEAQKMAQNFSKSS